MARILLAEDDGQIRDFLARTLRRAGHWVSAAGDGAAAVDELENNSFDLLLADVGMPDLDGVELAKRASKTCPNLRIVFITGFAAVALERGKGPNGSRATGLSKPFHLSRLVSQVSELLCA